MPLLLHTARKCSWLARRSAPSAVSRNLFPSCVNTYFEVGGTELEEVLFLGSTSRERRLIDGEVFAMFEETIGEIKEVGKMDEELEKFEDL